jgi:hypothetical protein
MILWFSMAGEASIGHMSILLALLGYMDQALHDCLINKLLVGNNN